jgi:peptide deformylase
MNKLLKIRQTGEPVLRRPSRLLSAEEVRSIAIGDLIEDMRDTMRDAPGVGLAAPQVGLGIQLVVIEDPAEYQREVPEAQLRERGRQPVPFHVLINPRLRILDPTPCWFFEGCLSIAGYQALTPRARQVEVDAWNEHAEPVKIRAEGWYARILQHEIDHLQGRLYLDHMHPRSFMSALNHGRYWQELSTEQVCGELGIDLS